MSNSTRFLTLLTTIIISFTLFIPTQDALAQWGVGASYEIRDEAPENGFGARIQRDLPLGPMASLGLRGHFSFFNDEIEVTRNDVTYSSEIESYDFGVALLAGVNVGLLKPYAGAGIGSENYESVADGFEEGSFEESSLYWNIFAGAEVSPIPVIKPFVEYRFVRLFDDENFDYKQNGRFAFGVLFKF